MDDDINELRDKFTKRGKRGAKKSEKQDVDPTEYDNQAFEDDESENSKRKSTQNPQVLAKKHRDKSRELSAQIIDENPIQVEEEMVGVRDKIKDKLKLNLQNQLEKFRNEEKKEDETQEKPERDYKLDLTSSSMDQTQTNFRLSAAETFRQKMLKMQQQTAEKNNYRLTGTARRETTRFNNEEKEDEDTKRIEKLKESIAKSKFRKAGLSVLEDIHLPNTEEQLDFFTKQTWEKDPTEIEEKQDNKKDESEKPDETKADDKTPLILNMEDDWREMTYGKAKYIPHELEKEIQNKKMFMPRSINVPFSKKISDENAKPRYLEEEGIYVGRKPYVTIKNRNLMENRLITFPDNTGLKWFGVDGDIIALPDPIKYVSTRPSFNPTYSEDLTAFYRKALYVDDFTKSNLTDKGSNTINIARYRLDLDINQIQFSFHHLFSEEHVISLRLENMCRHFKMSEEQNLIEILTEKLNALKKAMARFKSEIASHEREINENQSNSEMISQSDLARLTAYKNEIKLTRQQRDNESKLKKNLTEKILAAWKELKDIRIKQAYRNTDYKLVIKKKEVNKTKEEKSLEKELKEEFEEIIQEKKEIYDTEMVEYNKKFRAWKFQRTKKKEAAKRQEEREKNKDAVNHDINAIIQEKEQEERDTRILNEIDLVEPVKPEDINEDQIFESLQRHYNDCRKAPGDPILSFELVEESGVITPTNDCQDFERKRRSKLAKTRVYVKIYLNGKLVHKTNESQLQNDFTVKWGQIFNIYTITSPESVLLQLYENVDGRERMIAEITLPTPDVNCTSSNYNLEDFEFSSTETFYMYLKTTNQSELFFTSGKLKTGLGWGIDEKDGSILAPPKLINKSETAIQHDEIKNFDAIAALGVSHMQDLDKLAKWIFKSNLDPNDPRNSDLINLIRTLTDSDGTGSSFTSYKLPDYFRLDQAIEEFNFVTDEDLDKDKRLRMITLRDQMEPEFKGYRMIPVFDRLIKKDQFTEYDKRKQRDLTGEEEKEDDKFKSSKIIGYNMTNEIDLSRNRGQKIVQRIRQRILKQFKFAQNQKSLSDMIIEEQVPNINALSNLFWTLYVEPRRPLYPSRRERKKVKGQNISPDEVFIMINIVNAYDLPVRKDKLAKDPMQTIKDPITGKTIKVHENLAGESLVRPFVEVSFQGSVLKTFTADGPNASWNQELSLPFKAPNNDLRPESLQTCKDNIFFNIFDEVEVDALEDERERDHTVHRKKQRYWLGSLKIPFSTVYFKSKIEGTFKIETPPVILGYTRDPKLSHIQTFSSVESNINLDAPLKESSYLSLYVSIEPQLLVPDAYREGYDSIESIDLLDKVVTWSTGLKNKFINRDLRPIVMNSDGKSVLITRYIRAIKPPEELVEGNETSFETALNVAKFVSMIPFVSDSLIFPGICDVWSTCDQFMEILSGDEEEHSVLLVNFFLGLGKSAWLLIGSSITNGLCSYPLSIENGEYTIWYQGQPYKVNEPHNPVKVVSAVVGPEEIWFNTQPFDEPYRIKFDITNTRQWRPFFGKNSSNKFESIQPEKLTFIKTNQKHVSDLEIRLEEEIKKRIREWRVTNRSTIFHNMLTSILKRMLKDSEKNHNLKLQNYESDDLNRILQSYRISGFPLNMPYTNLDSILEAVKATQIHAIPTEDVQFAVAVYVHPYPNTILSVWVYLALVFPKSF